jgi:hypothetical protein
MGLREEDRVREGRKVYIGMISLTLRENIGDPLSDFIVLIS